MHMHIMKRKGKVWGANGFAAGLRTLYLYDNNCMGALCIQTIRCPTGNWQMSRRTNLYLGQHRSTCSHLCRSVHETTRVLEFFVASSFDGRYSINDINEGDCSNNNKKVVGLFCFRNWATIYISQPIENRNLPFMTVILSFIRDSRPTEIT